MFQGVVYVEVESYCDAGGFVVDLYFVEGFQCSVFVFCGYFCVLFYCVVFLGYFCEDCVEKGFVVEVGF